MSESEEWIFERGGGLHRLEVFLDKLHRRRIKPNSDAVIPVVGSEGVGKSTLILQAMLIWESVANGREWGSVDESTLFDRIYSTRRELQKAMISQEPGSIISVPDAGRVLYRKEAMVGEQRDLEKDFFDVRNRNYVFLLGFQDWRQIPDFLASRRATHAFFIPRRGVVWGYGRSTLDERDDERGLHSWPDPDLKDRYPDLEGTELWEAYQEYDAQKKMDRMGGDGIELDPEEVRRQEQTRLALRLTKPWSDDEGLTQVDAASYLDYTSSWVSHRRREWENGDLEIEVQE